MGVIKECSKDTIKAVTRDNNGKVIFTGIRRYTTNWGVENPELDTDCYGIELAKRFGVYKVHLEKDSLMVMTVMEKREKGIAPIHAIYDYNWDLG